MQIVKYKMVFEIKPRLLSLKTLIDGGVRDADVVAEYNGLLTELSELSKEVSELLKEHKWK